MKQLMGSERCCEIWIYSMEQHPKERERSHSFIPESGSLLFISFKEKWKEEKAVNEWNDQRCPKPAGAVSSSTKTKPIAPLLTAGQLVVCCWWRAAVFFLQLLGYGLPPLLQRRNSIPWISQFIPFHPSRPFLSCCFRFLYECSPFLFFCWLMKEWWKREREEVDWLSSFHNLLLRNLKNEILQWRRQSTINFSLSFHQSKTKEWTFIFNWFHSRACWLNGMD